MCLFDPICCRAEPGTGPGEHTHLPHACGERLCFVTQLVWQAAGRGMDWPLGSISGSCCGL